MSGSGTNLQALLEEPAVSPSIAFVLSDRPDVRALERAEAAGVETEVIEPDGFPDRETFDAAVLGALRDRRIEAVVSAGYMRMLGPAVLDAYDGRWLNVHPSLLPAFPGMSSVRDALEYGVKVTGVTVFVVDEGMDTGPVVLQEAIEVLEDDDWDSLEARVHEVEHRLLPRAVRAMIEGRLTVEGRKAHVIGE